MNEFILSISYPDGFTVASRNSVSRNSGISRYSGQIVQTDCLF